MRIIIYDEQEMRRDGFRCLFEEDIRCSVVAETGSGEGLLAEVADTEADVVLIASHLPGFQAVRLVKKVKELSAGIKVVILGPEDDLAFASNVFDAGAAACVSRLASFGELLGVIREVLATEATVSVEVFNAPLSEPPTSGNGAEEDVPLVAVSA